jgi:FAD/FMN-containing dehydrogenase
LQKYVAFCDQHYRLTGYRLNMCHAGFSVAQDQSSLLSYSFDGPMMSIDPTTSAGDPGWEEFLVAYNQFCSDNGGAPLLNQTKGLTAEQTKRAFGSRLDVFKRYQKQLDPDGRMVNDYFRDLLR